MSFREKPKGEDRNNYSQNADFKNSYTKKRHVIVQIRL